MKITMGQVSSAMESPSGPLTPRRGRHRPGAAGLVLAAIIWAAGCSAQQITGGSGPLPPTSPPTGAATAVPGISAVTGSSTTGPSTAGPLPASELPAEPVHNLPVTPAVTGGLISAFVAVKGLRSSDVSGVEPGSVHYSLEVVTGVYWASARFTLSPQASFQAQVSFQDGGDTAVFSRLDGAAWAVTVGRVPWPCPTDLPPEVLGAWGMTYSEYCPLTSPTPSQLGQLIVDSSAVPAGFVDQGTDTGPGQETVAGTSLGSASRRWVRTATPAGEDDVSVFLELFPTAHQATEFNSVSSQEYTAMGPLLDHTTVSGVPMSRAYLNGAPPLSPGSGQLALPPTASAFFNVGGVAVTVFVADYQENPLPVAQAVALSQYRRLLSASSG